MMNKNKKIKVCILQNGLARGGTDTFVVNLCSSIDKNKFNITVINPNAKTNERESDLLNSGVDLVHTSPLSGIYSTLKHFVMLYRVLRAKRFDVFQTNVDLFNGPNLFIAWLAGVPIRCCHSHNSMQQRELVEGRTLAIRLYQNFMRFLCWHFAIVIQGVLKRRWIFYLKGMIGIKIYILLLSIME